MDQRICKVTIEGKEYTYPAGISYTEILSDHAKKNPAEDPALLVMVNGRLRELHKQLKKDCVLERITRRNPIGYDTYRRSVCMLLVKAIYDLSGKTHTEHAVIHFSLGNGLYITIEGKQNLSKDYLDQLKQRMLELAEKELPIMKRSVATEEAIDIFHRQQMADKEKLFRYRRVSRVNLYSIEDYEDYFYGFMVQNTGYLKEFDLSMQDEGFILQLPPRIETEALAPATTYRKIFQVQKESEEWGKKMELSYVGELNDRISQEGVRNLLLIQEAMQEARIAEIARQIAQAGDKKFVMIAGPSSSGKTTFSHRLSIQLMANGLHPHPIALDNYFKNREDTPLDEEGNYNFECLEAIDVELFRHNMLTLLKGERLELPEFNFLTGIREYKGNYLQLGPEDILVVEGIHGLNEKLTRALPKESKFRIYISALTQLNIDEHNRIPTTDGRLIRRIVRDARTRGTSAQGTIAMWPSVRRGEEENIFPFQEEADVMFDSSLVYELACLKIYAEPLLFGIPHDAPEYPEAKRLLKFFDYFLPVPSEEIPQNSILREFVGGSCFRV